MRNDYRDLLKPEIINSLSGLALISRVIVDGQVAGLNQSKRVGGGLEFSQYRGYEPGDDLRLLDWKMLARSGRYYIKQAEIDTHISVKFIIDSSKSMLHREKDLSKIDFVKVLVASIGYFAWQQGDAVSLFSLNNKKSNSLFASSQKQHFNRFLSELVELKAEGVWPKDTSEIQKIHDKNHKELIFFITDLYQDQNEISKSIKQLKTSKNEITVLHIMGGKELSFDFEGAVIFEDLESGERIKVNAKEAKDRYLNAFNQQLSEYKNNFLSNAIGYELFSLDNGLEDSIKVFLNKRIALM
ncbi:DUF58 domain-containing protein [Galbibacter sp. BG1]|uniref:DUF58 domain-containing protein n=1 Tax=Galbibacter sp. BG1 TaxID=1170699 RepID=UPI0015BECA26|nr:DUF58 domain-containing protein [Galbibacter sp. BG1]QLE02694.1 DUF58 domain-containing protein [Galbibacter sp. BG1]